MYIEHAQAKRFIYKVRGECQSSIVELADGSLCILKLASEDKPNLFFNEAFGSELMRHFHLPIAEWAPIVVTNEFIDSAPELWRVGDKRSVRPPEGLHFGSKLVTSKSGIGTYQIIPSNWFSKVENAEDFVRALAIDIWANHCDRRQAIFASIGQTLHATFIDNGHLFGGPQGTDLTCPRRTMIHDLRMYRELPVEEILESWRLRIVGMNEHTLRSLLRRIPAAWYTEPIAGKVIEGLLSRRSKLTALFSEAVQIVRAGYSVAFDQFLSAIEPRT